MDWAMEKYGMTNSEWHKKIWNSKEGLCYYLEDGPYVTFSKIENPKNLLEEHVNEFLNDFPELNGEVSFIFTN
jgi:hypothetical protein